MIVQLDTDTSVFISHVQARAVREVNSETGIECSPLMLNEPQGVPDVQ
jgi:hypothetical protein